LIQIGLARLVTDNCTYAYITDVYVIPSFQGQGLGKWLLNCVNEHVGTWPDLREAILYAGGETAQRFYADVLGMRTFESGGKDGLVIMSKKGPGDFVSTDH
jgi:GNAT superfamily N-acetyltransferase